MREAAIATLKYDPGSEGTLWILVERTTKRDGSRAVTLTAERASNCHDEMVGENTSVYNCVVEWKEEERIPNSAFEMPADLGSARLETKLRGRVLSVRWRADDSCDPGGTRLKMGDRRAFGMGRWGDESFPWDEEGTGIFRQARPDSAQRSGTCDGGG